MTDDATRQTLLRGIAQAFEGLQRAGLTHTSRPAYRDPLPLDALSSVHSIIPSSPVADAHSIAEPPEVARPTMIAAPTTPAYVEQPPVEVESPPSRAMDTHSPSVSAAPQTPRAPSGPTLFETDAPRSGQPKLAAVGGVAAREPAFAPVTRSDREMGLAVLREEVRGCTQCALLAKLRKQTVFAAGNPHGKLVLVGEAPGADEDRLGEPFVGKAGKKLDEMIGAFGLDRTQVYIMNAIKCRPPENRVPASDELANCRPFFLRQLDLLAPKFILCLGTTAAQALLQRADSISRLRNKLHTYRGATVVCTYHPSYILRSPEKARRPVWEDLLLLMGEMGIRPKNKQS